MSAALSTTKAEIAKAIADGSPILAGLWDLSNYVSFSAELNTKIKEYTKGDEHRKVLLQAVLTAITALEADGYPVVPMLDLEKDLLEELRARIANILAAIAQIGAMPPASMMSINLGEPVKKP